MADQVAIVTVDAANVHEHGFFCYKSKPKAVGYRRKLDWLQSRFAEGLVIKIVSEGERSVGFIEYIPGEYAWRAVHAPDYMVIHCLWVVGQGKGKGHGSRLLEACVEDARQAGLAGVAMLASRGNWLAGSKLFLRHGFELVGQAPPAFELLVKRFGAAPPPTLPDDWDERLRRYGAGLTIFFSDQCPYLEDAVANAVAAGHEAGVETQVVELQSARQVRELSPSPYGVFGIVYDGRLLSYHSLGQKELLHRLSV
jgi:ribosomal protein S18 acetylase RimI-like enzyme